MSDDGPDAIGKNFASYLKTEGLPSNRQLADWLRSAFTAAQGEPISISPLAALLIVERLGGEDHPTHREPVERRGRHKKTGPELGEKTDLEDWDLIFDVWVRRERFEKNNDPAPTERAFEEIATESAIQATSVKRAFERARKRTGAGTGRLGDRK
jgi:hypothetical protein